MLAVVGKPSFMLGLTLPWAGGGVAVCGALMALALLLAISLPRGSELVFTSSRDGNLDIYLMDVSRLVSVNLTRHDANDCCATWSPDGQRIAFVSWRDGRNEVYVMDVSGDHLEHLDGRMRYGPLGVALSPDRQLIAYVSVRDGNPEIYVVDSNGRNQRRLTWNNADDFSPTWRPSGS
jgi:TolB protein